ncbi:hypothetical protein [Vibrio thalassae]|uniref:hypothetical protein n=1 Tax=Vibrio thalassae TaxID=1243014 RepID=UPI00362FB6FC
MTKYLLPLLLLLALPVRAATILNSIKPLEMITYELVQQAIQALHCSHKMLHLTITL